MEGGVALVATFAVILTIAFTEPTSNDTVGSDGTISEAEAEKRQQITQSVYDEASAEGANAEEVFQEALDAAKTPAETDAIRAGQLMYFTDTGNYDEVIRVGDEIGDSNGGDGDACESASMDIWAKIRCHNMVALAYGYMDQYEDADRHWDRMYELYDEADRLGLNGGN